MTATPWQVLGLEPGADALAVRRAYARLLKDVRSDVDAERFQLIGWAYEHALAQVAEREAAAAAASSTAAGDFGGGDAWLAHRLGESPRLHAALPRLLPALRAAGAAVPAFVAAGLDGYVARITAGVAALLLLATSGRMPLLAADTVGVLFWGFALALLGMRPWLDAAPAFAAAIGVVALLRELTFLRFSERAVTEHLVIQRRANLLAAVPILVMIAIVLWRRI